MLFVIEGVHGESFHRMDLYFYVITWEMIPMQLISEDLAKESGLKIGET